MPHKIAVLSNIHLLPESQEQIRELAGENLLFPDEEQRVSHDELVARTGAADAVLVSPGTPITAEYLEACPLVRYIGLCGTSKGGIDLEAVTTRDITLTNVTDYGDEPTAEFIFMQLTALARGTGPYQWEDMPRELMGKPIGIIGLGALGKAITSLALAYKMDVSYFSRTRNPAWEEKGAAYKEKETLLQDSRIVVISTPTDTMTLSEDDFSLLPPASVMVQASMGSCFDRNAFLQWIREGNFAVFDYAAGEENYRTYKDLPRVIFPKIIAGHTRETKERLGQKVVNNLRKYLEGIK